MSVALGIPGSIMSRKPEHSLSELLAFPCHYEFKAFGPADDGHQVFFNAVQRAVSSVVPVSKQAMKSRISSGGTYQCVTALVTLHDRDQLYAVYSALRSIDDLKYLL